MSGNHKNLHLRAGIIQAIREFFINRNYLEVETPYRIPAPAPEAHIDAPSSESWYLHTSPELCMKRLLSAGYPRIFQICKCFRKNERGERHIPEFTLLEWYTAENSYLDMMDQCEELIRFVAAKTGNGDSISYQGKEIDLNRPWDRMTVSDAFHRYSPISVERAVAEDRFDEMIAFEIEPNLGFKKPLFLYDYPACKGVLAKLKSGDKSLAERFELYISGIELCNAFTELTNPYEQRKRFEEEQQLRRLSGKTEYPVPEKFLESLKYMPEATGNALGVDRLVMLLADAVCIDAVVAFTPEEL